MLRILSWLLLLVGGKPVTQVTSEDGDDGGGLRNKVSVLGVLFAVGHFSLSIYCDYRSEVETYEDPETFREQNNILRAMVELRRYIAFLQQPCLAIMAIFQCRAYSSFLTSFEDFDVFLEGRGVKVQLLWRKMLIVERLVLTVLLLATVLNILGMVWLYVIYYGQNPNAFDIYTSVFPITNSLLHTLITSAYLYGTFIRMKSYNRDLKMMFADFRYHNRVK